MWLKVINAALSQAVDRVMELKVIDGAHAQFNVNSNIGRVIFIRTSGKS